MKNNKNENKTLHILAAGVKSTEDMVQKGGKCTP